MNKLLLLVLVCSFQVLFGQNPNNFLTKTTGIAGGTLQPFYSVKGDTVYAHCPQDEVGNNFYRSIDAGRTWLKIPVVHNGQNVVNDIIVGPSGKFYLVLNGIIWATADEGNNWQQLNSSPFSISQLVETHSGVLLRTQQAGPTLVFRSADGGLTWTEVFSNNPPVFNAYLKVFANNRVMLLKSSASDSWISNDDGSSWEEIPTANVLKNIWSAYSGTLFAYHENTTNPGLKRSTDGGHNWQDIDLAALFTANGLTFYDFFSMTFLPTGRIVASAADDDELNYNLYSDDDGQNWQLVIDPARAYNGNRLDYTVNGGEMLANTKEAIYRSSDGINWTYSGEGLDFASVWQIEAVDNDTRFLVSERGVWSTSGAQPWSRISENGRGVKASDSQHLVVCSYDNKAYFSNNGGNNFTEITPPGWKFIKTNAFNPNLKQYYYVFISPNDTVLFANAANNQGLLRSGDQGQSWTIISNEVVGLTDLQYHPNGRCYASTNQNKLWYSDDEGLHWTLVETFPANMDFIGESGVFISVPGAIVCRAESSLDNLGMLLRSDNNGESWIPIALPTISNYPPRQFAENALGHLFVINGRELYRSVDGGGSWSLISSLDAYSADGIGYWRGITLAPDQYLHAWSSFAGIYQSNYGTHTGAYLSGSIKKDADADCSTLDAQVAPLKNWIVEAIGADAFYTTTDSMGNYLMFIDTGHYQVKIHAPNLIWWNTCESVQSAYLPEPLARDTANFTALEVSNCPLITVNTSIPMLRRCFTSPVYVQYCNQSGENADSAWVDVTLDPYLSFVASSQPYLDLGNQMLRFFIGDLEGGDCGQFRFSVYVNCDSTVLGQTHCVTAHGYPDTLCSNVQGWSGANIEAMVQCQDTTVTFQLKNTGPVGSQVLDYIIIEDDVVMFNGQQQYGPNDSHTIHWPANGHTIRLESQQEPGHPFSHQVLAFQEGCGGFESLGFINQFSVNGITPSWHTTCIENQGSYDPNDKQGYPIGVGAEHRIRPGQPIEYLIRFQNTGTDTAFTVVIRDSISAELDPGSLLPGASSHPYSWHLSPDGKVTFSFSNILLPDSTTNLEGSKGFVTFKINQKPDLPLGTQIFNEAGIYFDFNAPVITNQTLHTLGLDLVSNTWESLQSKKSHLITLSPNPASDQVVFTALDKPFKNCRLQVFSPMGILLEQEDLFGEHFTLPRKNLPAGAYGWRVLDASGAFMEGGMLVFH